MLAKAKARYLFSNDLLLRIRNPAWHTIRMTALLGHGWFQMPALPVLWLAISSFTAGAAGSPIEISLSGQFASFTNRNHPGERIGYRFHEHLPLAWGEVPVTGTVGQTSLSLAAIKRFTARPGVKTFHRRVTEAGWIPQDWTFHLAPAADGIDLLWIVKTEDAGLREFYGVQQCFRLTGVANEGWRHNYARTAAFSEFDLWPHSTNEVPQTSLTWVLRQKSLQQLPPRRETVGCRTPYGEAMDTRRSGGQLDLQELVGHYQARMLWTADSGLILRTSVDRKWSTGVYWERTTHVTDHHPADCLHAIVNIGGIAPHSQRALRGKIYWLAGPGEILVKHWRKDFPAGK